MNDADSTSVEAMYSVASQCLHEKKNKRPDIKKVLIFYTHLKSKENGLEMYISSQLYNVVLLFVLFLFKRFNSCCKR
jgi:hypothetical protein